MSNYFENMTAKVAYKARLFDPDNSYILWKKESDETHHFNMKVLHILVVLVVKTQTVIQCKPIVNNSCSCPLDKSMIPELCAKARDARNATYQVYNVIPKNVTDLYVKILVDQELRTRPRLNSVMKLQPVQLAQVSYQIVKFFKRMLRNRINALLNITGRGTAMANKLRQITRRLRSFMDVIKYVENAWNRSSSCTAVASNIPPMLNTWIQASSFDQIAVGLKPILEELHRDLIVMNEMFSRLKNACPTNK